METELIEYMVQRIDGSRESVLEAVQAILVHLEENNGDLPRDVEQSFFEEIAKSVFDWIAKADQEAIREIISSLDKELLKHKELTYPTVDLNPRKRIGNQLNFFCDMMNVYLRSDLELKDVQRIMLGGKVQKRLRHILDFLYKKATPFNWEDLIRSGTYPNENKSSQKKAIQRDINMLIDYDLAQKNIFGKKNYYDLTPRAYFYKDKLTKMHKEETEKPVAPPPVIQTDPPAATGGYNSSRPPKWPGSVDETLARESELEIILQRENKTPLQEAFASNLSGSVESIKEKLLMAPESMNIVDIGQPS